ncbi:MAG: hypothetical protein AAB628_02385 [Patescibacteria group bacterium]
MSYIPIKEYPSILISLFIEEVLNDIVKIYEETAEITIREAFKPDLKNIVEALDERSYCELRLQSSFSRNTKLYFHRVHKPDGIHVAFDFDPNTSNDSWKIAEDAKKTFRQKTSEYLKAREIILA